MRERSRLLDPKRETNDRIVSPKPCMYHTSSKVGGVDQLQMSELDEITDRQVA